MISNPPHLKPTWARLKVPLVIYLVVLGAYLGAAGGRLTRVYRGDHCCHYAELASDLLAGRASLKGRPPHLNDWARVVELTLTDGRQVRGQFLSTGAANAFETTGGEILHVAPEEIRSQKEVYYVSFPWFPALLMLPFVAAFGAAFNDVFFTVCVGALNPVLVYLLLRRLARVGLSRRSLGDDLWLVGLFAFGTVHFYSSVVGQVWYTAHVVGVALTALYAIAAIEGRHPLLAGLFLGLGFVTRTPIPFSVALLVGEVLRRHLRPAQSAQQDAATTEMLEDPCHRPPLHRWVRALWPRISWGPTLRHLGLASFPVVSIAAIAFAFNLLRFGNPFEFGHSYLNIRWSERIQRWGLFNYHFVARNLAVMLTLMPRIMMKPPYIKISLHGLSLFVTTPIFAYLIWPRRRSPIQPWLYLSVLFPMLLHLFYQHTGYIQFGYRFSLDYTVYLIALLAVGGWPIGRAAKALILAGVVVNTFGAITYFRYWDFYWQGMFPVS